MAEIRHLRNAPIHEAIIEIRVEPEQASIEELESLTSRLPDGYTEIHPLISQEFSFQLGENISTQQESPNYVGYSICNAEKGYVVQIKKGGMTLSKLSPYQDWNTFKSEAETLWSIYKTLLTDYKFSRVAVRYINKLPLKLENDAIDFDEYLINCPRNPEGMGEQISGFFCKNIIPIPDKMVYVAIVQALEGIAGDDVPVIFDIDTYRNNVSDFSEAEIWEFLDVLQNFKNKAFFGSITERTAEICE